MPAQNKKQFQQAFARSLADAKAGRIAAMVALALHPAHSLIQILLDTSTWAESPNPFMAWMGSDLPWLGAAVWAFPERLEQDMIEAGCGAIFSHTHCPVEKDEAFIKHLGPLGCQVSGTGWTNGAFKSDEFPIALSIATFDIREGATSNNLLAGQERPVYWPEPLPMASRIWRPEDAPAFSPNFPAIAEILAWQTRSSVADSIREISGATSEEALSVLGGSTGLNARVARHFARQEHPMFGASRLAPELRTEALAAIDQARSAFERPALEASARRAADSSTPSRFKPRL